MADESGAPFGARACEVVANEQTGGYQLISVHDASGVEPRAGQFYMLAMARQWGGDSGRPYLGRAFSVAASAADGAGTRLSFLAEVVGPGTDRLASASVGETMTIVGPLGNGFSEPQKLNGSAGGAILVGGGIGIAPIAILRAHLVKLGVPTRTLIGFRDADHSGGLELFDCSEVRIASDDGHRGHHGRVTDLLAVAAAGDDPGSAVIYACGPPAMLEAVRFLARDRGIPTELAMEAPMACGYGACFGCAVPMTDGSIVRLCVDGPVLGAEAIETALLPGSGH